MYCYTDIYSFFFLPTDVAYALCQCLFFQLLWFLSVPMKSAVFPTGVVVPKSK